MRIFLDDERGCPLGYELVSTPTEAWYTIKENWDKLTAISLDHDLGEGYPTGYDLVCWIEQYVVEEGHPFPATLKKLNVHSANPVGSKRMVQVLQKLTDLTVTRYEAGQL